MVPIVAWDSQCREPLLRDPRGSQSRERTCRAWVLSPGRSRRADLLTFQVFNRALHPGLVRDVKRGVEQLGWAADLRIIDGGHSVVFRSGPIRLTEILSGPETTLPEAGLLFHSHLRARTIHHPSPGGVIEYQSCLGS